MNGRILINIKNRKISNYNERCNEVESEEIDKLKNEMIKLKNIIKTISIKCDPLSALKYGYINYENIVQEKLKSGYINKNELLTRKSLIKLSNDDNRRWIQTKKGIVCMSKNMASSYPFLSFEERLYPQLLPDKKVYDVLRAMNRYWDGKQWHYPSITKNEAYKLKCKLIDEGYEWPDIIKIDHCLQQPIKIKFNGELRSSVYNNREYVKYIRRIVFLQRSISRTHNRLRTRFINISNRIVYPILNKLGYSYRFLKYAKNLPHLHNRILNIINKPCNSIYINKQSKRLQVLLQKRHNIWKLRSIRYCLLQRLLKINKQYNQLTSNKYRLSLINTKSANQYLQNYHDQLDSINLSNDNNILNCIDTHEHKLCNILDPIDIENYNNKLEMKRMKYSNKELSKKVDDIKNNELIKNVKVNNKISKKVDNIKNNELSKNVVKEKKVIHKVLINNLSRLKLPNKKIHPDNNKHIITHKNQYKKLKEHYIFFKERTKIKPKTVYDKLDELKKQHDIIKNKIENFQKFKKFN